MLQEKMDVNYKHSSEKKSSEACIAKYQGFSTSTPFNNVQDLKQHLSVSIDSSCHQDSGLGASIIDLSVTSFASLSEECHTVDSCRTPMKCSTVGPHSHLPAFTLSASPVSSKRNPFTFKSNFSSRKSFLTRRSLESDFSVNSDDASDSGHPTLNLSCGSISRTKDKSLVRKLNLDIDIYDNNDCSGTTSSVFISPSEHEEVLSTKFEEILQSISPTVTDRLIGRKMGREYVDFVTELDSRNISCLSTILSYLDPEDLCRMCLVNQRWKAICDRNTPANRRRKRFIRRLHKAGKENMVGVRYKRNPEHLSRHDVRSEQHLRTIQHSVNENKQQTTKQTTTEHFAQAASRLKNDEKLQKCPRCRMAAKVLPVQERGHCQNTECKFDFCSKCSHNYHGSKTCELIATKKTKTDSIGTKKNKKTLRRL
ncbi:negative regulation of meiotic nuclear division [Mactra antiquata]